ncbi:MAG: hypothetical protein Q4C53_04725 [Clostridia bacterium]|nr:hypothetical protein [Clostridia bacterium]
MFKEQYKRDNDRLRLDEAVLGRAIARERAERARAVKLRRFSRIAAVAACFVLVGVGAVTALRNGTTAGTGGVMVASVMTDTADNDTMLFAARDAETESALLTANAAVPLAFEQQGDWIVEIGADTDENGEAAARVVVETPAGTTVLIQPGVFVSHKLEDGVLTLITEAAGEEPRVTIERETEDGPVPVSETRLSVPGGAKRLTGVYRNLGSADSVAFCELSAE